MSNNDELARLERFYFSHFRGSNSEKSKKYFNCSVYRIELYNLRERLLSFIKLEFNGFIRRHRLSNARTLNIRNKIRDNVRTDFSKLVKGRKVISALTKRAKDRQRLISKLKTSNIAANWQSFASCYTGKFLKDSREKRGEFNLEEESDPKELLEVLKNCSLFSEELYDHATTVIEDRNEYYAHLPKLFIRSGLIDALETSIQELKDLIRRLELINVDH